MNKPTSPNKSLHKNGKFERTLCIIGYLIVPTFFIILYCLMLMSYEDLHQSYSEMNMTIPGILNRIFHYIPRAGEFFQHVAVHHMSLTAAIGLDIIFRLAIATISSSLIYFCTYFVLGKKPSLHYKDLLIYLGFFLILMFSEVSEVFTYRFSYVNNYILAALITVTFLLPFRLKSSTDNIWAIIGMVILGFLFGISTEIGPLAFAIILFVWSIIKLTKKQLYFKNFFKTYKLQIFGILGVCCGLAFFYLGGGISNRTNGGYAEAYDYVSMLSILKGNALATIYKLWQHAWFNMRYLMFAPLLIGTFILVQNLIIKKYKKVSSAATLTIKIHAVVLSFCILYMGASCQIKVLDDMYPRYFFLVYLAIFISIFTFLKFLFDYFSFSEKSLKISSIICTTLSAIAIIDMTFAFTLYHIQLGDQLNLISPNPGKGVLVEPGYTHTTMIPSPIFKFAQMSPYDWGDIGSGYMKYGYGPKAEQ